MPTPYTITTSAGSFNIYPLETNGPGNLSTPRQINLAGVNTITVAGDLSGRFITGFVFNIINSANAGTYTVAAPGAVYNPTNDTTTFNITTSLPFSLPSVASVNFGFNRWDIVGNLAAELNPGAKFNIFSNTGLATPTTYTVALPAVYSAPNTEITVVETISGAATNDGLFSAVSYPITGVTPGPGGVGTTWTVSGEVAIRYPATTTFVVNNTGLPTGGATFTVLSSVNGVGTTTITVVESIPVTAVPTGTAFKTLDLPLGYIQYTVPAPTGVSTPLTLPGRGTPNWGEPYTQNFVDLLENFAGTTAPTAPLEGMIWYDTTTNELKFWDGTAWFALLTGGGIYVLKAGDTMTGKLYMPSTIPADLPTTAVTKDYVDTYYVAIAGDTMTGPLILNADPVANLGAATKQYVDALVSGLDVHEAVVVATTGPGTLATDFENGDLIDGVTLATGNRILIKDQVTQSENGVYVVNATGAPTRAADWDGTPSTGEVVPGSYVFVLQGTTNGRTAWVQTTPSPVIVGVSPQVFVIFTEIAVPLSSITAAVASNTINNGANLQTWRWNLGSGTADGMLITESAAATTQFGQAQELFKIETLNNSTASPFSVLTTTSGSPTYNIAVARTTATAGHDVSIAGGRGDIGGDVLLTGGVADTGEGGDITITAGNGPTAGDVSISGGTPTAGAGGDVSITATAGVGTNQDGGDVSINAGVATGIGANGTITLTAGNGDTFTVGSSAVVDVGTYFSVETASTERLRITATGEITLAGNAGTLGQVLTSQGPGTAPIWSSAASLSLPYDVLLAVIGNVTIPANIVGLFIAPRTVFIESSTLTSTIKARCVTAPLISEDPQVFMIRKYDTAFVTTDIATVTFNPTNTVGAIAAVAGSDITLNVGDMLQLFYVNDNITPGQGLSTTLANISVIVVGCAVATSCAMV